MDKRKQTIGITLGDLNGIGMEVVLKVLSDPEVRAQITPVVYGARWAWMLYKEQYATIPVECMREQIPGKPLPHCVNLVDCPVMPFQVTPGIPSRQSGAAARIFLQHGVKAVRERVVDGLVTAPVDKNTFYEKTFPYRGHTEYLAEVVGVRDRIMMMVGGGLRIGLVTEHISIKDVARKITSEHLSAQITLFEQSLIHDFQIAQPRIAVLGLNPHAGDEGLLGKEDHAVIKPVIDHFQHLGKIISGPFAADGFFAAGHAKKYDGILAMYHDQGLIPFKLIAFDEGVNYTAGLPIVRTSPDHGVAYDIAGKNCAKCNSMKQAIYVAASIIKNREGR